MKVSKRLFDIILAFIGLIILLPLFAVIAILIKNEDKGPVFFVQERVGYKGKHFNFYKFRSMLQDADKKGPQITVAGDKRITKIGRILRKYKLDELPQLFNVIKGDMSLVGPRPEVPYYVKMYNEAQKKVLNIIPGITDPASIAFYDENELLSKAQDPEKEYIYKIMPQKIKLNLNYASKADIFSDLVIILTTLGHAICKKG